MKMYAWEAETGTRWCSPCNTFETSWLLELWVSHWITRACSHASMEASLSAAPAPAGRSRHQLPEDKLREDGGDPLLKSSEVNKCRLNSCPGGSTQEIAGHLWRLEDPLDPCPLLQTRGIPVAWKSWVGNEKDLGVQIMLACLLKKNLEETIV